MKIDLAGSWCAGTRLPGGKTQVGHSVGVDIRERAARPKPITSRFGLIDAQDRAINARIEIGALRALRRAAKSSIVTDEDIGYAIPVDIASIVGKEGAISATTLRLWIGLERS